MYAKTREIESWKIGNYANSCHLHANQGDR